MKKFSFALVAALSLTVVGFTGCGGGGENQVIEVDPATADDGDGIDADPEEFDASMDAEMNQP